MSSVTQKDYIQMYLSEVSQIASQISPSEVGRFVAALRNLRTACGRLFILGVGGSAGNASHAVNDFRKIAGIESYAPTDNVSELSARVNDDGWDTSFVNWLRGSHLKKEDGVLVFSVGGGNLEKNISPNIVYALQFAQEIGAHIFGIVGRDGGYTAKVAEVCLVVPVVNPNTTTPHTESFQGVLWHLLVSHPDLKQNEMKWESAVGALQPANK